MAHAASSPPQSSQCWKPPCGSSKSSAAIGRFRFGKFITGYLAPNAPLKHASKPNSRYTNTRESSNAASDVAARGRLEGLLPWDAIEDETRPVDLNSAFHNLEEFFGQETENFLTGYWRNLLQSQPNYIEIIAEKLTLRATLSRVAQEHTMPMTIGRGMCSLSTKRRIYERFRCSRKEKLILLIVSDLDPAGDAIAEDYLKSFRRDFGVHKIEAYKCGPHDRTGART